MEVINLQDQEMGLRPSKDKDVHTELRRFNGVPLSAPMLGNNLKWEIVEIVD